MSSRQYKSIIDDEAAEWGERESDDDLLSPDRPGSGGRFERRDGSTCHAVRLLTHIDDTRKIGGGPHLNDATRKSASSPSDGESFSTQDIIRRPIRKTHSNRTPTLATPTPKNDEESNERMQIQRPGPSNQDNGTPSGFRSLFQCVICSYHTCRADYFNEHLKSTAHITYVSRNVQTKLPFWCTFCKKGFDNGHNFKSHIASKKHTAKVKAHLGPYFQG